MVKRYVKTVEEHLRKVVSGTTERATHLPAGLQSISP
jgi:hypothetical protein